MNEQVMQLHSALVSALIENRPNALDQPVTVAEIYQDLVPYRSVRSLLGFALNADYEFALLQLLAGEGKVVFIEPPEVREELLRELESSNPNVGLFRNYAACDVFVTIPDRPSNQRPPVAIGEDEPDPLEDEPASKSLSDDISRIQEVLGVSANDHSDVLPFSPPAGSRRAETMRSAASTLQEAPPPALSPDPAASRTSCFSCHSSLPAARDVRFCPFCGADQTRRPCGNCGELLEQGWRFCIRCGSNN